MHLPQNVNKSCGIYRIVNRRNGKFYVGSTKDAKDRKLLHFWHLDKGSHHCSRLQRAFNKEKDKNVFDFQMFIYCTEDLLISLEQWCIDIMNPAYNVNRIAGKPPAFNELPIDTQQRIRKRISSWMLSLGEKHPSRLPHNRKRRSNAWTGEGNPGNNPVIQNARKIRWEGPSNPNNNPFNIEMSRQRMAGERNPKSKLTEEDIRYIRVSDKKQKELAEEFGIDQSAISNIRARKRWKHVI